MQTQSSKVSHPRSGISMPLAARSVTRSTLDFLAANLAALILRAAESEIKRLKRVHVITLYDSTVVDP